MLVITRTPSRKANKVLVLLPCTHQHIHITVTRLTANSVDLRISSETSFTVTYADHSHTGHRIDISLESADYKTIEPKHYCLLKVDCVDQPLKIIALAIPVDRSDHTKIRLGFDGPQDYEIIRQEIYKPRSKDD